MRTVRLACLAAALVGASAVALGDAGCAGGCSQRGTCEAGVGCVCYPGWSGDDCSVPADCPNQCNLQGAHRAFRRAL